MEKEAGKMEKNVRQMHDEDKRKKCMDVCLHVGVDVHRNGRRWKDAADAGCGVP